MNIITRFAPSPTGYLHIGNARAALFCFLYARAGGGKFILRLDDTDQARSTKAFADAIIEDLNWLMLTPDATFKQSARFANYQTAFDKLRAQELAYPCYETQDELDIKRKRQLARGAPPVYDRTSLALSAEDIAKFEAQGRKPHWRFKLSGARVAWNDLIRGTQSIDTKSLSDPVIRRGDASWLYTLPSVVDDIDYQISHIIRGEDHVTNTATQIEMFAALNASFTPEFAHFSLLTAQDGSAFSKRDGASPLRDYRTEDFEPTSIISLLARLGSADPIIPTHDLDAIIKGFDISRLGRAPARFDPQDLTRLNAKILHAMPFETAYPRLRKKYDFGNNSGIAKILWETMRGNINHFDDIFVFFRIMLEKTSPVIADDDKEFLKIAHDCLPDGELTEESWDIWIGALKAESGRTGKALFMPLRLALTGRDSGPEMKKILPILKSVRTRARLLGETS